MRLLLDVNALIALGIDQHLFHSRVETWLASLAENETPELATCSITELGFVRIVSQVPSYGVTLEQAKIELRRLKGSTTYDFQFLADNNDISNLPDWVKTARQTTDGHLSALARSNGAILATLDENIPDSFLIPVE
jgi:predicted nucleic acid-binding protein